MNSRVFRLFAVLMVVALCVSGAMAATAHHPVASKAVLKTHHSAHVRPATLSANLYGTVAAFVGDQFTDNEYNIVADPYNGDDTFLWPCFGGATDEAGDNANQDCPTVGYPSQPLPFNAVVIGAPEYSWSLALCNASASTSGSCGQVEAWYEDDTNDSTDELIWTVTAQQGSSYVLDSGTTDFGPNVDGAFPGANIALTLGGVGLGTYGVTGANNGACAANYNYPLAAASNPGELYVVAAGKTCINPSAGTVAWTSTIEIAKPAYKKVTGTACTSLGVPSPCYTVKYTKKYSLAQKWDNYLE
jgi:hypothetical protein